jgi:hypothetical protein
MTSKASAGDKLVASIRKTRSSAAERTAPEQPVEKPAEKAAAKPAASKKRATPARKKAATRSKPASANAEQKKQLTGLFQSRRRVWPD